MVSPFCWNMNFSGRKPAVPSKAPPLPLLKMFSRG